MSRSLSRSAVVPAPPAEVFDLLADPRRHAEIDGSGTVKGVVSGPERLTLGARFGMRMHFGLPYFIHNEVVELVPDRRIAWRHVGHHVWRYELEPTDGGTLVTSYCDWSSIDPVWKDAGIFPVLSDVALRATLGILARTVTHGGAGSPR